MYKKNIEDKFSQNDINLSQINFSFHNDKSRGEYNPAHIGTQLIIIPNYLRSSYTEPVELIERKGIGHPDSHSDLIAEKFSSLYSKYCIERFGYILNHWSDKVLLAGGIADLDYGKCIVKKDITAYLFGRVTSKAFGEIIDYETIFRKAVAEVIERIFPNTDILNHIKYVCNTNLNLGKDHPKDFFEPNSKNIFTMYKDMSVSNDTVMTNAYAPLSKAEFLTIHIENYINSPSFKAFFPEIGSDVKVLTVRKNDFFDFTICIPFIALKTPSFKFYKARLNEIYNILKTHLEYFLDKNLFDIHLNTKDQGNFGYLTAFGSSLDKGDYGAVGRGNKLNGIISVTRESNIEAASGKNPLLHSGKIYNHLAQNIANRFYETFNSNILVNIVTRNGAFLDEPTYIFLKFLSSQYDEDKIREIIYQELSNISLLTEKIINRDPVFEFSNMSIPFK